MTTPPPIAPDVIAELESAARRLDALRNDPPRPGYGHPYEYQYTAGGWYVDDDAIERDEDLVRVHTTALLAAAKRANEIGRIIDEVEKREAAYERGNIAGYVCKQIRKRLEELQ